MRFISLLILLAINAMASQPNILIFSKTAGFRHDSIEVGAQALSQLLKKNDYNCIHSEDSQLFNDKNLKQFRAIIFLSTTGDILNKEQQLAFQRFIQAGGGFVGIHAASDTEYNWAWYMRLIGAQFSSHPQTQTAVQEKCACEHPSTDFLPNRWSRKDEWYNFKNFSPNITPLLNLDESTYQGGQNGDYHPSAWFQEYDGGRMFYTAGGHTKESFKEPLFLKHILGGVDYVCSGPEIDYNKVLPDDENFSIKELSSGLEDPIAIAVSASDQVFIIERKGAVKLQAQGQTKKIFQLDAIHKEIAQGGDNIAKECGGLGIALDPDFSQNQYIYIYYSPKEKSCNRLSRFTFKNNTLINEVKILDVDTDRTHQTCHEGGSLAFGNNRQLFISTGDNTNPFASNGSAPINEKPGQKFYDAQRSAGNSNDLRGSILRITINKDASYSIPAGNLYPQGQAKTRPEIYIKGCRNPYKMSLDKDSETVYWGEVGPDASNNSRRGPMGYDELNRAKRAGYYGWPYFVGDQAYSDFDFKTAQVSAPFANPASNDSPNNTGLNKLPEFNAPILMYPYKKLDNFPDLGNGSRNAMAGPFYNQQMRSKSFPAYFDETLFFYDWARAKIFLIKFNEQNKIHSLTPFLSNHSLVHPIDIQQSPKGEIYILNYGSGWWNNNDGTLKKVTFEGFNRRPIISMSADKRDGPLPLQVQFSARDSYDKDGDNLTYHWDFGNGQSSQEINPKITYTKPSIYTVKLTIKDSAGKMSTKQIQIFAGNERPQVELLSLSTGPKLFTWGKEISYVVKATDKEDGLIDPSLIEVTAEYRPDGSLPTTNDELADPRLEGMNLLHEGTQLIVSNNCLTCHQSQAKSIGPSYAQIAEKYADSAKNRNYLIKKLKNGGNGAWGHMPMPPQAHINDDKLNKMVSAIMEMAKPSNLISKGKNGRLSFIEKPKKQRDSQGIYVVKASYKDKGNSLVPSLMGTSKTFVLSPAILIDDNKAVLNTRQAIIDGTHARKEGDHNIGYYENIDTSIYWNLYVANPGKYNVTLYQSCPKDKAGSSFELQVPGSQLKGIIKGTNNWTDYTRVELGVINIPHPGTQKFIFKPTLINHGVLANIKSIVLQRLK